MRQRIILTLTALVCFAVGYAGNISVDGITMKPGENKALMISLSSTVSEMVGVQFDMILPEGFSLEKYDDNNVYKLSSNQSSDITCNVSELGKNAFRFILYSGTLQKLKSGDLMNLNLKVGSNMALGSYTISISNVAFSDIDGKVIKEDGISVPVKVTNFFTLLYKVDDIDYKSYNIEYGAVITAEPAPTKEGYTFSGWSEIPETMPAHDVTITGFFTQNIVITAKSYSREYGEDNPIFEYTSEGATIVGVPEITCEATATSTVGTYPIIIKKGSVTNNCDTYVNGVLTITKAPLTVKAGTYTRKQGEDNPEFTLTYEGWKNNETETMLTEKPVVTTTAIKESAPGEYKVTVSGGEAKNYELSYINGKLIVTDADAVVVTAKSYTRIYGDANPTFEYTSEGATLVGAPEITCEATATSPVGTYPIVIKKGTVTNYNDTYINGTLTITKAPLAVKTETYTRKQGEDNPEFTLTYEGWKNNETEEVLTKKPTATTTATKESEPGEYEVTISGGEATNYELSYTNGKLTITEADPVTITAKSYSREYGEANPTFEFTSEGATLVGVPEITCEATATSPVGTYPIVIEKGTVTNYNDTYINGTLTITKAPLTVKVENVTREQYLENPEFVIIYTGWKLNDDENVLTKKPTATTTATKESPVGEYEIVVSGGEAKNYELSYENGILTVTESTGIATISVTHPVNVYNVQGRMVRSKATTLDGLPKGVYIVNGRKVIVR